MLALSLPLRWLRVTVVLNTMIALHELFIRPVTWPKDLALMHQSILALPIPPRATPGHLHFFFL